MIIGQDQHHPPLSLGEHDIEYVDNFMYLGSNMSSKETWRRTYEQELAKLQECSNGYATYGRPMPSLQAIKLCLYMSVVIPTATYACETWMRTASITNMLDVFHRRCLRTILRISWRDHITNEEVMRRTGALLSDMVSDRRRRLAGHVLRLPRERPVSVAMDWVPEGGKRKRGRPKTWRHTFKEDLSEMGVSWHGAWRVASDRCRWSGGDSSPNVPAGTGGTKSK
ncbi:hypothetical protein AAFF_G00308680 [Aldrovandia affinis]|uniref:Uncharacterized protein n=1 Tax=Aldrovandia affinis TaxID=143900 RepID=A0AAD7SNR3_9TELE|nr:hypothetical protein AAFF_G00308680 [Aldrovandia affinis]